MFNPEYIEKFKLANPKVYQLFRDAKNPRNARSAVRSYIEKMISKLDKNTERIVPLEWTLQVSCLLTLKKIFSIRSERLTRYSIILVLYNIAKEKYDQLPDELNDGFFEEIIHLFLGIRGKSGIYENEPYPEFTHHTGRDAAISRSAQLDQMAEHCFKYIKRYKSGLDEDIINKRKVNKERISNYFQANSDDWGNYLWQIRHVIRDVDQLQELIDLTDNEKRAIQLARENHLPFGITPYYVSLMDKEPDRVHDHAVRAQVIPPLDYVEYMISNRDDRTQCFDFMMEQDTSPIDLITRRYPMICILKPYNTCSQICVYCQRNWEIQDVLATDALATRDHISNALEWIRQHPAITEVLITGGDPLVMNNERINWVLSQVAEIKHVERIRIGSRTPVVLPQRITDELLEIISQYHVPGLREVVLVSHFEHPYEITPEAMQAVQKFKKQGISVYNQAVYTIENSRRFEMVALRRLLRLIGVDPYYTFNTKGKEETKSYRVPLARLQQEIKEEARLLPGTVRTDEAVYNVPKLGKNYIRAQQHHSILTILPEGKRVYEFHPWEKNLSMADTFIDTDVSIYDYLQTLEKRGEDINDYKSIWYYI